MSLRAALRVADAWDLSNVGVDQIQSAARRPIGWSELNWHHLLTQHWHNRLVHFPLVLTCLVAGLAWLCLHREQFLPLLRGLLPPTALLACLAVWLGLRQAGPFRDGPLSLFLVWHQSIGIACSAGLCVAAILVIWRPQALRPLVGLLSLLVLGMLAAGFLGGVLVTQ